MAKISLKPIRKPMTRAEHLKRRVLWLCFFLCLGGASLVCIGGKACLQAWQSRGWTAVPCTIDNSGINSQYKPGHNKTYTFFVTYHYTFAGQDYHSESGTFEPDAELDWKTVTALSNRYPAQHQETCYVNPQQPTVAVLDRSVSRRDLLSTIAGVALVLASLGGVTWTKRRKW